MRIFIIIMILALSCCSIYTDDRSYYSHEDHSLIESCMMAIERTGSKSDDFYENYIRSEYGVVSISRNSYSNYTTLNFGRDDVKASEKSRIVEPPPITCVINVEKDKVVGLEVPEGFRSIKERIKPDSDELDREYQKLKDAARNGEVATVTHKLYYYKDNTWTQMGKEEVSSIPVKDML